MAWLLTYMSSLGSNVLIATHSDYLLAELGIISVIIKKRSLDKGARVLGELIGMSSEKAFNIVKEIIENKPDVKIYTFHRGSVEGIAVEKN